MTEQTVEIVVPMSPRSDSKQLFERILERRLARISEASGPAVAKRWLRRLDGDLRTDPESTEIDREMGRSIAEGRPFIDNRPRPASVLDVDIFVKLREEIIPALIRANPSATRTDLTNLVKDMWPNANAGGSKFDPELIREFHDALLRENPGWNSKIAVMEIARRLNASEGSIKDLLRAARSKKN